MDALLADQQELQALFHEKRALIRATRTNEVAQQSIERSLVALRRNYDELKTALKWLDIADEYDREDQVTEVLRLNAQAEEKAAECPITASMVRSIPLLNLQSVERTEFDNLVAGGPWTEHEDRKLISSVQAASRRALAIEMHTDRYFDGDPVEAAAQLSDEEALNFAEPRSSSDEVGRIDWNMVAVSVTQRNSEECRTRWLQVCRTAVNSSAWRADEIKKLRSLVESHPAPSNWEHIASSLGTNRTAYACFQAYCRSRPESREAWTPAGDAQLVSLFELYSSSWRMIALHHPSTKTQLQIYGRFNRSVDPSIIRGKFSPEEDAVLINTIKRYGTDDWTRVAAHVAGRSSNQCRERWLGRLDKRLAGDGTEVKPQTRKLWSAEDDERLTSLLTDQFTPKDGGKWTDLAKILVGFSDKQVRERSLVLKAHAEKGTAPRRPRKGPKRQHELVCPHQSCQRSYSQQTRLNKHLETHSQQPESRDNTQSSEADSQSQLPS